MSFIKILNLLASFLLFLSVSSAEESFYKFRIYKDFVKDIFSNNLKMIFEKTEKLQAKNIELQELGTRMTNVRFGIQPRSRSYGGQNLDLFFDEGRIII